MNQAERLLDDYFDNLDNNQDKNKTKNTPEKNNMNIQNDQEEEDPLEAYMRSVAAEIKDEENTKKAQPKGIITQFEEEDDFDTFMKFKEKRDLQELEKKSKGLIPMDEIEYDSDDNPIIPTGAEARYKKSMELPPIDYDELEYELAKKVFFTPNMTPEEVSLRRTEKEIWVQRLHSSNFKEENKNEKKEDKLPSIHSIGPIDKFSELPFGPKLLNAISKNGFETPTPIQSQSIPLILSGYDIIGLAKTGSGKTACYLFPLIVHILDQSEILKDEGPIGLILAPTRELANQIFLQATRFSKPYSLNVVPIYGGMSKYDQIKSLKNGCHIVVATPGRLVDLIKLKGLNLKRTTYVVLDECDKMFDLGFENQVRSILNQIRPERQTCLFSATLKKNVERLIQDLIANNPIRINVGQIGQANSDISQKIHVFENIQGKTLWLFENIDRFVSEGSVLIFCLTKSTVEELHLKLKKAEFRVGSLHGDREQEEREEIMKKFKKREIDIIIATDLASRGLDIPSIRNVVSFEMPKEIESHTHRIGRTGRRGEKGSASILLSPSDQKFAKLLIEHLKRNNIDPPKSLIALSNIQYNPNKINSSTQYSNNENNTPNTTRNFQSKKSKTGLGFKKGNSSSTGSDRIQFVPASED